MTTPVPGQGALRKLIEMAAPTHLGWPQPVLVGPEPGQRVSSSPLVVTGPIRSGHASRPTWTNEVDDSAYDH